MVELIVQAATIAALLAAGWQLWESRKSTTELSRIKDSLTTRFLGHFPNYNNDIAEIIKRAKSEVVILCDVPGYGVISDPLAWSRIVESIQWALSKGISVRIHAYDDAHIRDMLREQGFEDLDEERFRKRVGIQTETFTPEQALEASVALHKSIILRDFAECDVVRIDHKIPLYFWMIDGREAIVSIPTYAEGITEYGFCTSDRSLLTALHSMIPRMMRTTGSTRTNSSVPHIR